MTTMKYHQLPFLFLFLTLLLPTSTDPCDSTYPHATWMTDLHTISPLNHTHQWSTRRLNEILLAGTHDAGLYTITAKSGIGIFLPDDMFVTQNQNLLLQSCSGSRVFDMRFTFREGQWVVFHGTSTSFSAYGIDLLSSINFVKEFYGGGERYKREILVWRVKLWEGDVGGFVEVLRKELGEYMVDSLTGNETLPMMTLQDIWDQPTKGHLLVMAYGWTPSPVTPGKQQGWIWDYRSNQLGEYSDAVDMSGMLTRCTYGQFPRLLEYKASSNNTPAHPLIGLWWTFTTGDILDNTMRQWKLYPYALNDFFALNSGEIGNVFMVDFFGNYPDVMRIVWDYNFNKFGVSPERPPAMGYTVMDQPPIPGKAMVSGSETCRDITSATDSFRTEIIIIFVFLVLVLFILVVVVVVVQCHFCRKKRQVQEGQAETTYLL